MVLKIVRVFESETLELVIEIGSEVLKDPSQGVTLRYADLCLPKLCACTNNSSPSSAFEVLFLVSSLSPFYPFLCSSGGLVTIMYNFCNGKF